MLLKTVTVLVTLLPLSSSEQVVVGVAGKKLNLPCPGWGHGPCSWNVSASSTRMSTNPLTCELEVNPVLPEDAGVHECSTGHVELQVRAEPGPPVVLEAKKSGKVEVEEGEEVRLECQSQGGLPPAEIIWRQEGSSEVDGLRGTKQHVEKREDGRTFRTTSEIKFLPTKDVTIECWAESEELGVKRFSPVQIELVAPPKVSLRSDGKRVSEVWVEEGESAEVECEVEARPMNLTYTWTLGGKEVEGEKSSSLEIEGREELDRLEVVCSVENQAGVDQERAVLRIFKPPVITVHPGTVFADEGKEGRLKCEASGRPKPAIAWIREDTGEVVRLGPELIIPEVTSKTEGRFLCQALVPNRPPTSSKAGLLVVRSPPHIVSVEEGKLGDRTVLECKVYSPGEGTLFQWIQGGQRKVVQEERENLKDKISYASFIVLEKGETAAEYSCKVTNNVGEDERKVLIEEASLILPILLGVFIPLLLILLVIVFVWAIGRQRSRESLEAMERGKRERKRCLSHRNISFVED